jgi:hypothetical protein
MQGMGIDAIIATLLKRKVSSRSLADGIAVADDIDHILVKTRRLCVAGRVCG